MGPTIAAGIIVLFALIIVWGITVSRKQAAARRQRALDLGFTPVAQPDPELVERIAALRRRRGDKGTRVQNVFRKEGDGYRIYILDAVAVGDEEDTTSHGNVVLVSPHLRLPAFTLFPKIEAEGFMAATANRVVTSLIERSMPLVEMPAHPRFSRRYSLFAESPEEARAALPDAVLDHLGEAGGCAVEASGDAFMVGHVPLHAKGSGPVKGQLEESLREAAILFELLRDER